MKRYILILILSYALFNICSAQTTWGGAIICQGCQSDLDTTNFRIEEVNNKFSPADTDSGGGFTLKFKKGVENFKSVELMINIDKYGYEYVNETDQKFGVIKRNIPKNLKEADGLSIYIRRKKEVLNVTDTLNQKKSIEDKSTYRDTIKTILYDTVPVFTNETPFFLEPELIENNVKFKELVLPSIVTTIGLGSTVYGWVEFNNSKRIYKLYEDNVTSNTYELLEDTKHTFGSREEAYRKAESKRKWSATVIATGGILTISGACWIYSKIKNQKKKRENETLGKVNLDIHGNGILLKYNF